MSTSKEKTVVTKSNPKDIPASIGTNSLTSNDLASNKLWAQEVIDTGLLPDSITDPEQVLVIVQQGMELGLHPFVALNNLHVIKGRPVLSATMLGALLKNRKIEWIITEDYNPIKDDKGEVINYRTTYKFFWKSQVTGGTMSAEHSVTWNQLTLAGYTDKQNYERFPKEMMRARCLSSGVRAYFPEVLLGMYTDLEIAEEYKDDYNVEFVDGEVKIIDNAQNK